MLVKILLIIFMFSENNGKKVNLLKPNPLMQEKAKKEEEEKVAEVQRGLNWWPEEQKSGQRTRLQKISKTRKPKEGSILKLILRAETEVLRNSASYKSEWKEIM